MSAEVYTYIAVHVYVYVVSGVSILCASAHITPLKVAVSFLVQAIKDKAVPSESHELD